MIRLMLIVATACALPAVATRLFFLAPFRAGAVFYYSNVLSDFLDKRTVFRRGVVEHLLLIVALVLFMGSGYPGWVMAVAIGSLVFGLELALRFREREILTSVYGHVDTRNSRWSRDQMTPADFGAFPRPSVHPDLVVNLRGPFVSRLPGYDLGDLALGRTVHIEVIIGNHSRMPCQVPVRVTTETTSGLQSSTESSFEFGALAWGDVVRKRLVISAGAVGRRQEILIRVIHGDWSQEIRVACRSVFDSEHDAPVEALITRYPGGCRSAFAWRGDMDLYDTSSFQSIEGLQHTLCLASRYRFPQTMYLSARLSLDVDEAKIFADHFRVNRGHDEIPAFIEWIRGNAELRHCAPYPFESARPYVLELGNHMYLHYGTDAAAAEGNDWLLWAKMGDGRYEWQGSDRSSFGEQRDNAMAARLEFEKHFGFTPRSWAMPDSTSDEHTPAAVEAAGCQVTSDADARQVDNVIFQPRPHHPEGTGVVELTKRYPGDPEDFTHVQMFLYWLHRGWRLSIPVIFMCHQHMRLFSGLACSRMTEYVMRYVLTRFNGDFYIDTVYGLGVYWNEVFSPKNSSVRVSCADGKIVVQNLGDVDLANVPVDIVYRGGRRATVLVDLPPGATVSIGAIGRVDAATSVK